MKKFIKILFIVAVISTAGIIFTSETDVSVVREYYRELRPCSVPLKYAIGENDSRFNIAQADLTGLIQEAENFWESSLGKNLLEYDNKSKFKINLVYDERQIMAIEAEKISENLGELELSHEAIAKKYDNIQSDYSQKVKSYEKSLSEYQDRLREYNDDVEYWNGKGGAPEDEYEDLVSEKDDLKKMYEELEKKRKEINKLAGKTNDLVVEEKNILNQYNASVSTFKKLFGGTREFEKGVFSGNEINIYQFKEKSDLKLTIIHELGHALGFGHVENPESIMYYLIGEQNINNPALTQEDLAEVKKVCK